MLTPRRRELPDAPPTKVAGFIYLFLGVFAVTVSAFIFALPESFYGDVRYKTFFGAATGAWGLFRIATGIKTIRKASAFEKQIALNGEVPVSSTPEMKTQ